MYQFFEDKDAVLQALALRFIAAMPGTMDEVEGPTWQATVERTVDAYAAVVRAHPAIRRLWLSGTLDTATREAERELDAGLAVRLGSLLAAQAGAGQGQPAQWRALVALINGLLIHAFTEDPAGDDAALGETRRAAVAYTEAVLGLPGPRFDRQQRG